MINFRLFIISLLLLYAYSHDMQAQSSRKELEAKRVRLKKEIEKIKTYLYKTKKKEKSLLNEVRDLNQKIKTREELIRTLSNEINALDTQISGNEKRIRELKKELEKLKKEYAALIYESYKNRSKETRLMFILSSNDFFQAYRRFQYLKQYSEYRKRQGDSILAKSLRITTLNDSLKVLKDHKKELLDEKKYEQEKISGEKQKHEELVKKYSKQQKKYIAEIKKKQREEKALTRRIESAIRKAITRSSGKKAKKFTLTKEAARLSGKFEANKGKLPWPVEKGLVTLGFGEQTDPLDPKLKTSSSGILIATDENAKARAIFSGVVLAVQKNPQTGVRSVLIQHGQYISVYANLKSVSVSKGQKVKTKQKIGAIYTHPITGKTELKFQIWKTVHPQNPLKWIYKM